MTTQQPSPGAAATATAPAPVTPGTDQRAALAQQAPLSATSAAKGKPRDTPRQLRRLIAAVIAASLLFGLLGLTIFLLLTNAMQRAEAATDQTIRVQEIQTDLLRADAIATNSFLVGGLEPPEQRAAYDEAITEASRLIAEAADAEPADQQALALLNTELLSYTENIELARANNRQGFPVGAQYLRTASTELRGEGLPILENLVAANALRASSQMKATIAVPFAVIQLLLIGVLVWVQIWLARRFKRRFNTGLVAATVVGLLTVLLSTILIGWASVSLNGVREGDFADVRAASSARVAGNDAKSNESLTLIARGSGSAFEEAWVESSESVDYQLTRFRDVSQVWQPYVDVHTRIRALDDSGQWDDAVTLATTESNTTFSAFDDTVARLVSSSSSATTDGLSGLRPWMIVGAVVAGLAGIAMAVLGRRGVAQRLKEYR